MKIILDEIDTQELGELIAMFQAPLDGCIDCASPDNDPVELRSRIAELNSRVATLKAELVESRRLLAEADDKARK